eukprot:9343047-Pyramimonas_sp.AAC.1
MGRARTLLSIAPTLVGAAFDSFAERGMRPHAGNGKSAALRQFRGAGANKAKLAPWRDGRPLRGEQYTAWAIRVTRRTSVRPLGRGIRRRAQHGP